MPFWIAYSQANGTRDTGTETQLSPKPTRVEYPQEPAGSRIQTVSSVIVQQPLYDTRVRSWIWENYADWLPAYQTLWAQIEPLRSRYRKLASAGNSPFIWVREDETKQLRTISVSGTTVTPTYGWLRARVIEVSRAMRTSGSSLVVWGETKLSFVLEDASYNDLG